jgi:hypothetical protein
MRTEEPIFGEILSRPCAAQDAGSSYFLSASASFVGILRTTYKSGLNIRQIVDLEDLGGRIGTIFGKAAIYIISESCSAGAQVKTHP